MLLAVTSSINAVHADPQVAIPDYTVAVTLSASVIDDTGTPVAGATVTWENTLAPATPELTSTTDATGVATLDVKLADLAEIGNVTVFPYLVYLDPAAKNLGKTVTVRIADDTFKTPQVNDGGDFSIDAYDIAGGVSVTIQDYPFAAPGDLVTFYWDEIHSAGLSVADPETDLPWIIDIKTAFPPECLVNNTYSLYYQVRDVNSNFAVSLPRIEQVVGGQPVPTLPAADFPEADHNGGVINSSLALNGTPAQLYWQGMAEGDVVALTWTVYNQDSVQQTTANLPGIVDTDSIADGYLTITIDASLIPQKIQDGYAEAWYTMTPVNGDDAQTSAVATVGIDTQG